MISMNWMATASVRSWHVLIRTTFLHYIVAMEMTSRHLAQYWCLCHNPALVADYWRLISLRQSSSLWPLFKREPYYIICLGFQCTQLACSRIRNNNATFVIVIILSNKTKSDNIIINFIIHELVAIGMFNHTDNNYTTFIRACKRILIPTSAAIAQAYLCVFPHDFVSYSTSFFSLVIFLIFGTYSVLFSSLTSSTFLKLDFTYVLSYLLTYLLTYLLIYLLIYLFIYLFIYILIYLLTYLHTRLLT